jgi:glycosyltransferase involved in cell wall biosynthesis
MQSAMPLVSVIVPTRNRASLLSRTLHTICAQHAVDLEILVVDDGSTDGTPAIAAAVDTRVRVIPNEGPPSVSAARNRGIIEARGEWIAFCDDDDLWAPEKLAAQLSAARAARAGWVYSGDVNVDDSLRVLSGAPPPAPHEVVEALRRRNPLSSGGSNVLVRADVLAAAGGFDTSLRRTEDWDLWLRLASLGAPAWVCRPHVAYRFHSMNIAADVNSMVTEPMRLAKRYGIAVDVAAMHRRAAWTALRAGDRRNAMRHYTRAVARGDVRSIARAAFALVQPFGANNAMFGLLRRDPPWVADAQQWLAGLTQPSSAVVATSGPGRP